ncbi:recombinase family protein [Gordonia sp. ABSL1-1]|uniref:recombinase family protein n=1 Tax=Gordonia sp. ABSL1-1 TaxID=3053923 RepID=UPI002572F98E|nr:recombinase family protein [Gordonia sp. ABSL1-1]MDL9938283.1 recombinase family protein [Gordonia sp. ABSL1-1]
MRVLGRVRLSRSTEESTSVERQREVVEQWAEREGHTVVGWAVDDGVSGSIDPFKTPEFGRWLTSPDLIDTYDAIAAWKLDRLGRSSIHLHALFGWADEHNKSLVSVTENIDMSNWVGQMIAGLLSGLAKGELEAIRERQLASRQKLRQLGRWPGGQFPYGYKPVDNPDGPGFVLAVDESAQAVIHEMIRDVVDGRGVAYAVKRLNEAGTPIPAEHRKAVRGKPFDPSKTWKQQTVRQVLKSKALLGYQVVKGETVRDDSGNPVLIGEPLVTLDEFEKVQQALAPKGKTAPRRRAAPSPLAGIVVCHGCRRPLHYDRSTHKRERKSGEIREYEYVYLRHPVEFSPGPECSSTPIPEQLAMSYVEEFVLDEIGDDEMVERVWVSGDSKSDEIRQVLSDLDDLTEMIGTLSSESGKQRLQKQIQAKDAQLAELEQAPTTEAHWEFRPLGRTYRDAWSEMTDDERHDMLVRAGITVGLRIDSEGNRRKPTESHPVFFDVHVPEDLRERLSSV